MTQMSRNHEGKRRKVKKVLEIRKKERVKKRSRIEGRRYDVGRGWGGERLRQRAESTAWQMSSIAEDSYFAQ